MTIIGSEIAKTYFKEQNPIGEYLQIAGARYMVIGVLKEKGESLFGSADKNFLSQFLPQNDFLKQILWICIIFKQKSRTSSSSS